jgi:hypothetical protein
MVRIGAGPHSRAHTGAGPRRRRVLVPESIDNPKMMDRLQAGDDAGEQVGRVLDQNLERPVHVFVLGDDDHRGDHHH